MLFVVILKTFTYIMCNIIIYSFLFLLFTVLMERPLEMAWLSSLCDVTKYTDCANILLLTFFFVYSQRHFVDNTSSLQAISLSICTL